jgi:hypothetical protein
MCGLLLCIFNRPFCTIQKLYVPNQFTPVANYNYTIQTPQTSYGDKKLTGRLCKTERSITQQKVQFTFQAGSVQTSHKNPTFIISQPTSLRATLLVEVQVRNDEYLWLRAWGSKSVLCNNKASICLSLIFKLSISILESCTYADFNFSGFCIAFWSM